MRLKVLVTACESLGGGETNRGQPDINPGHTPNYIPLKTFYFLVSLCEAIAQSSGLASSKQTQSSPDLLFYLYRSSDSQWQAEAPR